MINTSATYGGAYSESTAVRFAVERLGMVAVHDKQPLSEAMVFGISGGIGFAYFTMSYQGQIPNLYVGAAHRYKTKFGEYMVPFFERTGLKQKVKTASTANAAEKYLLQALGQGQPVIVHADLGVLPYDVAGRTYIDHALVVERFNEQDDTYVVADRAGVPVTIGREELRRARESISSLKNRACIIEAPVPTEIDLKDAIRAGIVACYQTLQNPPTPKGNFGLEGMRKWAKLINDPKNKSGWPTLFPQGLPLYQALHMTFLFIEILQSSRGALRGLYADYLREASAVLEIPQLADVASRYDQLSAMWTGLAEAALSSDVPLLATTKQFERQKDELFRNRGLDALDDLRTIEDELRSLKEQAMNEFPLNESASRELLDNLRARIEEIVQAEEAAIADLQQLVPSTAAE